MKCTPILCAGRSVGAFAVAAALAMVFAPSSPSQAEIEPKYYRGWQDKAPEVLTIRVNVVRPVVTSERHRSGDGMLIHTRVEAEATVEKVERSASSLKPGDAIRIQYLTTRAEPPMVGPRPIPLVKAGETYPAFMVGVSKGVYGAAARGASFEKLIEAK